MKKGYNIPKAVFIVDEEGWKIDFPVNPDYAWFTDEIRSYIEKSNLSPLEKKIKIKEIIDYNYLQKTKDLDKHIARDLGISVGEVRTCRCRARKKIDKKLKQFAGILWSFHKDTKALRSFKARHILYDDEVEKSEAEFRKAKKQTQLQKKKKRKLNKERSPSKERKMYIIEG